MKRLSHARHGFTLIELSIVLVIIGLIAGGILVGSSLIEAAKLRRQVSQITEISQAANTFKLKYGAFPGDIPNAAQLVEINAINGNGNGLINDNQGVSPIREIMGEPVFFFQHLRLSGLFVPEWMKNGPASDGGECRVGFSPGGVQALATNPTGGMLATTLRGFHWLYLGITYCANGMNWLGGTSPNASSPNGVMTPAQALAIDQKIDDGVPGTGNVFATQISDVTSDCPGASCLTGALDTTAGQCVTTSAATAYNATNSDNWCRLLVRMQ